MFDSVGSLVKDKSLKILFVLHIFLPKTIHKIIERKRWIDIFRREYWIASFFCYIFSWKTHDLMHE